MTYQSHASNLVAGDTNGDYDIFVWERENEWDPKAEFLSKEIAYRQLGDGSEFALSDYGYEDDVLRTVKVFSHSNGFHAYGLTAENEDPILVVRGTEPDQGVADIYADFDPAGVGAEQYASMRTQIEAWIGTVTAGDERLSITGHSLGGALAQLIAAGATAKGYEFEHITTFNSPGISQTEVDRFNPANAIEVRHYITNGDIVSMAGEEYLPGDWRRATFSGINLKDKHLLPVLVDEITSGGETRLRAPDVKIKEFSSTSNLSSDYYFHTDAAYWGWLFAGQLATRVEPLTAFATIPSKLFFRKTTEDIREEIGTAWREIEAEVAIYVTPLDCNDPDSSLMFPNIEVELAEFISIQATELKISCQAGDSTSLIMHGQVTIPELFNVSADFTGDNYLELTSDGEFNIVGDLSAEDIPLGGDYLILKEVGLHIDTVNDIWEASGALEIVPWEVTVGGTLGFQQGEWNLVSAELDGINKPLGPIFPTAFLQRLSGEVEHFAPSDMEPVDFSAGVGITAGPTYSLNLPNWAGGSINSQLAEIDLEASINENRFKGAGTVEILEGLAIVTGEVEWNWDKDYLQASGAVDLLDGLIVGNASFRANDNLDITMQASATLNNIPRSIHWIGGKTGLTGNFVFQLINDNTKANDYIAAWTTIDVLGKPRVFGYRLYFDGRVKSIGSKSLPVAAPEGPLEGEFLSSDYTMPADTEWALFAASWDGDGAGGEIVLSTPSGVLITEAEIASRSDMAIVSEFSDSKRRVVLVTSPEAGDWSVSVNDATGLGNITYLSSIADALPEISILQATGGLNDAPVQIDYSALDPDSDASISFYYDTTRSGFDGIEIIGNILESDASSSLNWDTAGVANGLYYIYAVIDDGINAPVSVYLGSPIQVSSNGFEFTINAEIGDTQVGDTVDSLPASQSTLHEWETVTIDLWGQVPSIPEGAIDGVDFTMQFNSLYYADPVVIDSLGSAGLVVSEVSGDIREVRVTLSAVDVSGLTAGDIFLVTQLQFAPSGHDLPSQEVGDYFTVVHDLGFHLSEVAYAIDNLTSIVETISHTAATELVPVVYDIDNNGSVGLSDLARLVNVFGQSVGVGTPNSFAADFDQNGVIGLSDLAKLVNHFGLGQGSNVPIVLPVIDPGQTEMSVPLEAEPIDVASAVPNFFQESIAQPIRRMKLMNIHAEEEMIDQIYEFENRLDHDDWKLWLSDEESMITFLAEEQSRIDFELEEELFGAL